MRSDQSACSLVVDGREVPITFSKREGGQFDSEESKHWPGGGAPQKALGGPATVENVTLNGEFIPEEHSEIIAFLRSRRGKSEAVVTEQFLDDDNNAFGAPDTWTGKLKAVHTGDYDASSGEAREVEIEISTHGSAS